MLILVLSIPGINAGAFRTIPVKPPEEGWIERTPEKR